MESVIVDVHVNVQANISLGLRYKLRWRLFRWTPSWLWRRDTTSPTPAQCYNAASEMICERAPEYSWLNSPPFRIVALINSLKLRPKQGVEVLGAETGFQRNQVRNYNGC